MATKEEQRQFIERVGALAAADMQASGVLASLTIAQAILESGWGTSELATNANALFGIKADARWPGKAYSKETKECYDGVNYTTVTALFRAYGSWEESVNDHSDFLVGSSRYAAVIGETNYRKAAEAIKAAGYATAPDYAEQLVRLIETYGLTTYDGAGEEENTLEIRQLFLTENACYKSGRHITVKGIMVHSTGANNPNLCRYIGPDDGVVGPNRYGNHWNQYTPGGREVCVHGFIGKDKNGVVRAYQTLPWNMRGWHAGGSANDTHIGFEICEDDLTSRTYFEEVYEKAVQLCVYLCKEFNLDPSKDGVLICHSEGHARGIASNHGDVMHWWPKHGKTMGDFRKAVKSALSGAGNTGGTTTPPTPETPPSGSTDGTAGAFQAGDIVRFAGGPHYKSSNAASAAGSPTAGPAKVTAVAAGAKHPYHIIHTDAASTVYGWVDASALSAAGGSAEASTYTVQASDTLWGIATRLLGSGSRYTEIKALNGLGSDTITTGQKLKIPGGSTGRAPEAVKTAQVGSTVRLKSGAKTYTGGGLASFVYERDHIIKELKGDRAVITYGGVTVAAVHVSDLIVK